MSTASSSKRFKTYLKDNRLNHDEYSRSNLLIYRPRHLIMRRAIERYLDKNQRSTIADIGCHNAFFLNYSSDLGFSRFVGLDFFELSADRSFLANLKGAEFVKSDFNQVGFMKALEDQSVDCVVSTEVFEHILNSPFGYMEECWRVLKPGGLLLFTTPNPCTLMNAARLFLGRTMLWGDEAFAMRTKWGESAETSWDIHFREYPPHVMQKIALKLPNAKLAEKGFVANGVSPDGDIFKRFFLRIAWMLGLGHSRLFAATQYLIIKKTA